MKTYLIDYGEGKDCVCADNLMEAVKFHKKETGRDHGEYLEAKEIDMELSMVFSARQLPEIYQKFKDALKPAIICSIDY